MKDIVLHQPLLLTRWGFSFFSLILALWLVGCGSSSPRFASSDKEKKKTEKTRKGSIRFSSKIVEEETREDDRKVDVKKVGERFSSAKPSSASAKTVEPTTPKNIVHESEKPADHASTNADNFEQQKMMDAILAWMGTPYEYGGESKSGIDCSGFTKEIFKESAAMQLPRTTEDQVKLGSPVDADNLKFGDLIFFNTTGQNPSHVGIYIGDDMFAHASVSFGVTLSSMYSSYYKKRYTEARRVIN
ncbi:MAG: NlpC/P60 family protein [Bacteroidota bacterium]|nr:NlpC/P60 family protein [Bacteroidota bacterium]